MHINWVTEQTIERLVDTVAGGCMRGIVMGYSTSMESQGLESVCYQLGSICIITHMAPAMNTSLPMQCCPSGAEKMWGGRQEYWNHLKPEVRHHVFFPLAWGGDNPQYLSTLPSIRHLRASLSRSKYTHTHSCSHARTQSSSLSLSLAHTHTHTQTRKHVNTHTHRHRVAHTCTHTHTELLTRTHTKFLSVSITHTDTRLLVMLCVQQNYPPISYLSLYLSNLFTYILRNLR